MAIGKIVSSAEDADYDTLRNSSVAESHELGGGLTLYEKKCLLINREIDAMVTQDPPSFSSGMGS